MRANCQWDNSHLGIVFLQILFRSRFLANSLLGVVAYFLTAFRYRFQGNFYLGVGNSHLGIGLGNFSFEFLIRVRQNDSDRKQGSVLTKYPFRGRKFPYRDRPPENVGTIRNVQREPFDNFIRQYLGIVLRMYSILGIGAYGVKFPVNFLRY